MKKITLFLITIFMAFSLYGWGQTTIWSEDFTGQNDEGLTDSNLGPYTSVSGKWNAEINTSVGSGPFDGAYDWFMVKNELYEGCDVDYEGVWNSESFDISGYTNVSISIDVFEIGSHEGTDYIRSYYNIDGAGEIMFGEVTDDFTSDVLSISGLSGTSLIVTVRMLNNAGSEYLQFDDIVVTGTAAGGVNNPTSFAATTSSVSQIDLTWVKNGNGNDVMVAWSSDETFGTPSGSYSAGNSISGGGTVIYNGSATSFNHESLTSGTQYYYKAWSVDGSMAYSSGVTDDATTYKDTPTNYPTSFTANAASAFRILLAWTDASGGQLPDNYLIKASTLDNISDPIDGTAVADNIIIGDNSGAINIAQGVEGYEWTGLSSSTTYYFKIYPYTNSGTNIDYKTDETVPADNATTSATPIPPNVFISEYIEGTSNNKAIEIVNATTGIIDLTDFVVKLASNGDDWGNTLELSGSLNPGAVYVICNSGAEAIVSSKSDITSNVTWFNGNDALGLFYQELFIDGIGIQGEDPGTAWDVAGTSDATLNYTLVRKLSITSGNTNWASSAGTDASDSEWIVFSQDHFFNLGVFGTGWSGETDNVWATATNWDVQVPDATVSALINSSATNYFPTLGSSVNCKNIVIESNASIVGIDNLTVNGMAEVEQTIGEYTSASDGYHFLSSPVTSQTIAGSDFEPTVGVDDFFSWDEATNTWLNYYDGMTDTEFVVGKGYLVAYTPNNKAAFTGTLNNGTEVESLSFTTGEGEGWNLLGNPYPSAIDWDLLTKTVDMNGTVYVLKGTDNTYDSWNGIVGDLTDGEIPKNNGFFVKAESDGESVTIETTDQVHGSIPFLKKGNNQNPESTLKVSISNEIYVNNTYVQFREDATADFDVAIDGYKLFGSSDAPQIFTNLSGTEYSINCLPYSIEGTQLPLGFKNRVASEYTISASGIESFMDGDFEVFLEDTETNDLINLEEESYTFTADGVNYDERFILHFSGITTLGEELLAEDVQIYSDGNSVYFRFETMPKDDAQVSVFNTIGQQVYVGQVGQSTLSSIRLNEKPGIYIVRVHTENGIVVQKVLIN